MVDAAFARDSHRSCLADPGQGRRAGADFQMGPRDLLEKTYCASVAFQGQLCHVGSSLGARLVEVVELEKTLEALRSGSGSGPRTAAEIGGGGWRGPCSALHWDRAPSYAGAAMPAQKDGLCEPAAQLTRSCASWCA